MIDNARWESWGGGQIAFNVDGANLHNFMVSYETRSEEREKVQMDGYWQTPSFLGKASFDMSGILTANNPTEYNIRRGEWRNAFQPMGQFGYPSDGKLIMLWLGYPPEEIYYECSLDGSEPDLPLQGSDGPSRSDYTISLKSMDARAYGSGVNQATVGAPVSSGGFDIPFTIPLDIGASSAGGQTVLHNSGNTATYLDMLLVGELVNPQISMSYLGFNYRLVFENLHLPVGQNAFIDGRHRSVKTNDGSDIYGRLSDDSNWFMLPPGDHQLNFFASGGTGQVVYSWRNAYKV